MDKASLLQFCRYYHGEDECPDDILHSLRGYLFWMSEKMWVEEGCDQSSRIFGIKCSLDDESMMLRDAPRTSLNIPFDLRCILFEILCHYGDVDPMQLVGDFDQLAEEYFTQV